MSLEIKLLSAHELITQADAINEMEPNILNHGLKAKFPKNTTEELATIKSYQDDLKRLISAERICRKTDRSTAHIENGKIKIIRRTGKWSLFGTLNYLEPHEALFLMEINRLEIYIDSVIVSLERAYFIFLRNQTDSNGCNKLTKEEYLIYSHFMRFGCNIQKFKNELNLTSNECAESAVPFSSNINSLRPLYAWNYLYELLGHRKSVIPPSSIDSTIYDEVKTSMNKIVGNIKGQTESAGNDASTSSRILIATESSSTGAIISGKRKASEEFESQLPSAKKSNVLSDIESMADQYFGSGSLNSFMVGDEFRQFRNIFEKIDVIQLAQVDIGESNDDSPDGLRFSFDLWTNTNNTKKAQIRGPNFRIVVIRGPLKILPHSDDIIRLYRKQMHKSAIIVICVNEELTFHAYVYRFTTA